MFSSTISIGSTNAVLPDADSSYTKPGIFFLFPTATGISILPSRTETDASSSATPSSCALRNIAWILREMAPSFSRIERRISKRASLALSLTSPKRSRMVSMRWETSGNVNIGSDIFFRQGYSPSPVFLKKFNILRSVSRVSLNLARDMVSIWEYPACNGIRKGIQSIKPESGKEDSNICMSLISSVRLSLCSISFLLVEKASSSTLWRPYSVPHLAEIISLILSKPILGSIFSG